MPARCAQALERLDTKYMDYSLGYAPRLGIMIGKSEFLYFIRSQLSEVRVMINSLVTLVNGETMEDVLGPPGISGNPDKILRRIENCQSLRRHASLG